MAVVHPLRTNTPSGANAARNATRMSSRTERAAKADSAAASEVVESIVGGCEAQPASASARAAAGIVFMAANPTPSSMSGGYRT